MEDRTLWRWLAILVLLLAPATTLAQDAGAADAETARLAEQGEGIFLQQCSPCHSIGGSDRPTGPDLAGVSERRDRQWLLRMILEPEKLIAEDPDARQLAEKFPMAMPDVGLSESEAAAVIAFLTFPGEEEHRAGEPGATPPAAAAPAGDPSRGEALYIGTASFGNGGSPCLACHGIAGHGLGGGASFAPDLTGAYQNFGQDLPSLLEEMPFPSMEPIYAGRPLTPEERGDLTAFLAEVSGQAPRVVGPLALGAGIGAAVFFILVFFAGWRRLHGVRRELVENRNREGGEEL